MTVGAETKISLLHEALGCIAFDRKNAVGGYLSRAQMVEMARRALIEAGLDWPIRHGDGYGSRE